MYKRRPMPSISFHDIPQNIVVFFQILKGIECEMRQCESLPQVWQPSWKWRNINTLVSLYTRAHTHTHTCTHIFFYSTRDDFGSFASIYYQFIFFTCGPGCFLYLKCLFFFFCGLLVIA